MLSSFALWRRQKGRMEMGLEWVDLRYGLDWGAAVCEIVDTEQAQPHHECI